jgi:hypothetical protein
MMDNEKRVISESPFLKVLRDIIGQDYNYEVKDLSSTIPALVIKSQGKEIRFETQNSKERYLLKLFKLCLEIGKEGWISDWVWYYVEDDHVIGDPAGSYCYHFFICQSGKILKNYSWSEDTPDGLLKEKNDPFFYTDIENQMAETRMYYEDYLQNSQYGKLLLNRMKNDRDIELFGFMNPCVDEHPLYAVITTMNGIRNELKWQRSILVVSFIMIAAILLYKL